MEDRWESWDFRAPSCIIDTFKCPVEQPRERSWEYHQKGTSSSFVVKYEVVCSIGEPRVIWLDGPFRGNAHDGTIAGKSGVKEFLKNELVGADKIYKGDKVNFIVPIKGHRFELFDEERAYNYIIYRFRQTVEQLIERLKNWGFLHLKWKQSMALHEKAMKSIGKLTNLALLFIPLG